MAALIKFGLKCAIAGGAVYTAVVVLESPESLKSSLHHLQAKAAQNLLRVPVDVDLSLPEVHPPSSTLIRQEWNIRVQNVFASLDEAPDAMKSLAVQGYEKTKKLIQDQK